MLVEGNYGDDDGLSFDIFQVGLRQHSHSLTPAVLGEDECVAAQAHGARLEAIPVNAYGLQAGLTRALLCKAEAAHNGEESLK